MIIELAGPPGSGKSTIAETVQALAARDPTAQALPALEMAKALLASKRWPLPWNLVETLSGLGFCLRRASLAWLVLRAQWARPGPLSHRILALVWLVRIGGRHRFLQRNMPAGSTAVFAEGLANHAANFFSSDRQAPQADLIRQYVQRLPPPDLLIALSVPTEICLRRLEDRGEVPRRAQGKSREALERFVAHQARAVNLVTEQARALHWPMIELDNALPLQAVRDDLRGKLAVLVSSD